MNENYNENSPLCIITSPFSNYIFWDFDSNILIYRGLKR